jgi:hypothetical protein
MIPKKPFTFDPAAFDNAAEELRPILVRRQVEQALGTIGITIEELKEVLDDL